MLTILKLPQPCLFKLFMLWTESPTSSLVLDLILQNLKPDQTDSANPEPVLVLPFSI